MDGGGGGGGAGGGGGRKEGRTDGLQVAVARNAGKSAPSTSARDCALTTYLQFPWQQLCGQHLGNGLVDRAAERVELGEPDGAADLVQGADHAGQSSHLRLTERALHVRQHLGNPAAQQVTRQEVQRLHRQAHVLHVRHTSGSQYVEQGSLLGFISREPLHTVS